MQLNLLYASIQMMPLGLLKCVIIWLSAQLTEEEAKAVLMGVSLAGSLLSDSFFFFKYIIGMPLKLTPY